MKRRAIKSLKIFYLIFLANKKVFSALTRGNGLNSANRPAFAIYFEWRNLGHDVYGRDWNLSQRFKTTKKAPSLDAFL